MCAAVRQWQVDAQPWCYLIQSNCCFLQSLSLFPDLPGDNVSSFPPASAVFHQFSFSNIFPHHHEYSCLLIPGSFSPFSPMGSHPPQRISRFRQLSEGWNDWNDWKLKCLQRGSLVLPFFSDILEPHTPTRLSLLCGFQYESSTLPRQRSFEMGAISSDKAVGNPRGFSRN